MTGHTEPPRTLCACFRPERLFSQLGVAMLAQSRGFPKFPAGARCFHPRSCTSKPVTKCNTPVEYSIAICDQAHQTCGGRKDVIVFADIKKSHLFNLPYMGVTHQGPSLTSKDERQKLHRPLGFFIWIEPLTGPSSQGGIEKPTTWHLLAWFTFLRSTFNFTPPILPFVAEISNHHFSHSQMSPFPWDQLKAETLRLVCKDLGASPAIKRNRESMLSFLVNIGNLGCAFAILSLGHVPLLTSELRKFWQ